MKLIGTRPKFQLDRGILPDAIEHVVYEYSNLVHSAQYVNESPGGPIGVHVGDVFLLNCRKCADFFGSGPNHFGDIRAAYFCSRNPLPRIHLKHHRHWRKAINQNLAHISFDRVRNPRPFYTVADGKARVVQLANELRDAFRLFLAHIDAEYNEAFKHELEQRSRVVGIQLP